MYPILLEFIDSHIANKDISEDRKEILQPLILYIQDKISLNKPINLNFICTHNSRRSHFSQIWAQVASSYYKVKGVHCYSGGTESTAVYPKVIEILINQGFKIDMISPGINPIYAIKYSVTEFPIIGFSKTFDSSFNPESSFAAIMTCSQADEGCPYVPGCERRISIMYDDPKISDNRKDQNETYKARSVEIGREMFYVFSKLIIPDL
ncbi:low molecular weight phosphatase family protein [Sphingobacterium sp. 1.A.5]|uniref:arsenate-mycothiol transferase ArsC n=1 Tax=Sphingobacterium sp. 1.A.5 TaxID=2044604 RepID=UPI000C0BC7ED|nr:protein-tyrosine-phosphatase [Sphingobacterium sp. 1.A.5]